MQKEDNCPHSYKVSQHRKEDQSVSDEMVKQELIVLAICGSLDYDALEQREPVDP